MEVEKRDNEAIDMLKKQLMSVKSQKKRQKVLNEFTTNINSDKALNRYNKIKQKVNQTEPVSEKFCHILGWALVISYIIFAIVPFGSGLSDITGYTFIFGLPVWIIMKLVRFIKSFKEDYYRNLKNI